MEQFSKMKTFLQVFFKDFVDRFGTTYLKNEFLRRCFLKILLTDLKLAPNLRTGSSK